MEIKIGVAYHKEAPLLTGDVYLPIQVGKALHPDVDLHIQGDDEKCNISLENHYMCELTALYWMWKNVNAQYKGLIHYRRIFTDSHNLSFYLRDKLARLRNKVYIPTIWENECSFLHEAERMSVQIPRILQSNPIIATKKVFTPQTMRDFFSIIGQNFIEVLEKSVSLLYPEKRDAFIDMLNGHTFSFANMTVMETTLFDEYCSFLFRTLENVKELLISESWVLNLDNERIIERKLGYLGEILTNFFISEKSSICQVKELGVLANR